jgi:hypothetical protein
VIHRLAPRLPLKGVWELSSGREPERVRAIAPPRSLRALSTLPRVDYMDACLAEAPALQERTAEQWARAMLEDAPPDTRRALRWVWKGLGLKLGSTSDERRVLGWEVRRSSPDVALLGANSLLGLRGEVLLKRRSESLLCATFIQFQNPLARAVWSRVAPGHRQTVRNLLEEAVARADGPSRARGPGTSSRRPV